MREKILTLLERNSRMTAEEIAVLLGSSSEVIAGEIRKMEQENIWVTAIRLPAISSARRHKCRRLHAERS